MTTPLKPFQARMRDALTGRFLALKQQYDAAAQAGGDAALHELRLKQAAVMLQAPTGVGKTLIAVSTLQAFSAHERVVWFWFVPFTGLVSQAQATFQAQAPSIKLLSLEADRFAESLRPGGVYTLSWQSVASSQARRVLRETRDDGLSVDDLILQARQLGYRIGCVVDEAHHGFKRAAEASLFFSNVLKPDYALLMTATPRDEDAVHFSRKTGYRLGEPGEWATITREQGVEAGLLKPEVKTVRFIARAGAEARMLDFEQVALTQATAMHRRIKQELDHLGVGITPLLLVQVPNGAEAVDAAERMLVDELGFAASAVRKHTADEPDENLAALANDPDTEVLIFKMAVALGFDAPRAFTLAALRGVRDREFGIQVVGRIMRVHRLLQGREDVPALLTSGYVFLANQEDQEGLRNAAELINTLRQQEPELGRQTVMTWAVGESSADLSVATESGCVALSDSPDAGEPTATPAPDARSEHAGANASQSAAGDAPDAQASGRAAGNAGGLAGVRPEVLREARQLLANLRAHGQLSLLIERGDAQASAQTAERAAEREGLLSTTLADTLVGAAVGAGAARQYRRVCGAPTTLKTERLPGLPDNFEEQVASLVDFTQVLGDRDRTRTQLTQRTEGLFDDADTPLDENILAQLSVSVIAERAKQVALPFDDVDERDFLRRLEERFKQALQRQGIEAPADDELLRRQLDLVLVRNPRLIREAHRRVRAGLIEVADVCVPDFLIAANNLARSAKNIYGVFPPGLNQDEREFANLLDTDSDVRWWHRNPASGASSIALWAWSGGVHAFHPDFIVAVEGRAHADGQALIEIKGEHLQEWEKAKAGAQARHHGRVFMVGKRGDDGNFYFLYLENNQLQMDGLYEAQRLKTNA